MSNAPKDYQGPFIYGTPATLELARRCGYPEWMLKLTKPIPVPAMEPMYRYGGEI